MSSVLIKNGLIVNEGKAFTGNILIENAVIARLSEDDIPAGNKAGTIIDAKGRLVMPGVIDEHVHFRDPGLTHKADIASESAAAVAGGVTSFMEMPNTLPNAVTLEILESKFRKAESESLANFSFYLGATNDNLDQIMKADYSKVCGVKVFLGSSTGNMLVSAKEMLESLFSVKAIPIAVHSEDESIVKKNLDEAKSKYGENVPASMHPVIRNAEACYKSTYTAVELAHKYNTRLHILHVSTDRELSLFDNKTPLKDKRITSEVCVNHLIFSDKDYADKGNLIKVNPAIKSENDRTALINGLINNAIDAVATDHAPHTYAEKNESYFKAPSGSPMIQHALPVMLEFYHDGILTLEKIVEKMCHAPAILYGIRKRGFLREGCFADITIVDLNNPWTVTNENTLYKCGWTPLAGRILKSRVTHTIVNGNIVNDNGKINTRYKGEKLVFDR